MTHGDSFQQIAALRAEVQREFQRAAVEINILREIVLQLRREFDDYVRAGAIPLKEKMNPELMREPDMGPEV